MLAATSPPVGAGWGLQLTVVEEGARDISVTLMRLIWRDVPVSSALRGVYMWLSSYNVLWMFVYMQRRQHGACARRDGTLPA